MFPLSELREVHLELSERCNARCPMCGRYERDGSVNTFLADRELSLDMLSRNFPATLLRQLSTVRLCGNFGEPVAAREFVPIVEYLRASAPALRLVLNTNGSLRPAKFWYELGRLFADGRSAVYFGVDGLGATHEEYRRGTSFSRVMENMEAFIRGGGAAHWIYLVFEHNEHQIEEARSAALRIGCRQFTIKRTKRFWSRSRGLEWEWRGASNGVPIVLRAPNDPELRNGRLRVLESRPCGEAAREGAREGRSEDDDLAPCAVECRSQALRGIYVSGAGLVFPCCWLGAEYLPAGEVSSETRRFVDSSASHGAGEISLHFESLETILRSAFFTALRMTFEEPARVLRTCARICGIAQVSTAQVSADDDTWSGRCQTDPLIANGSERSRAFDDQFMHEALKPVVRVRDF